jgi:hypothetical protein
VLPVDHIGHACQVRPCHATLHSVLKLFVFFAPAQAQSGYPLLTSLATTRLAINFAAMAPHLTPAELDKIRVWHGKSKLAPVQVHEKLLAWRTRRGLDCPDLTNVRRVLRGESYRQGLVETRGKKRLITRRQVLAMNAKRKELVKKAEGEHEVRWKDVIKKTRGVTLKPLSFVLSWLV